MHRNDSDLWSERGAGLADLKGHDPLDRRIEKEKQEKYAAALREQMAGHRDSSADDGSSVRRGAAASSSRASSWGARASPVMRAGGSMAGMDSLYPPDREMHGTHYPVDRSDLPPISPGVSSRTPPRTPLIGSTYVDEKNKLAAEKVQQVQELMGQRLRAMEERQERQWQSVQDMMKGQLASVHEAAEQAAKRQFGDALQDQAAELEQLRRAIESVMHEKKMGDELLQSLQDQLREQQQEIERLRSAKTDCALAHEACARDRTELQQRQQGLEDQLRGMKSQLQSQSVEIDRLKAEKVSRDELHQEINRLREEMPRMAARAAKDALASAPRPPSPPRAPSPTPVAVAPAPDVSEEAFAVLRDVDGSKYELPNMENVVGRSPACDACVPGSQAISNKHMSIYFASDGVASVKDLSSRNGTFLNEHRVQPGPGLVLKAGDHIQLGVDGPSVVFEWGPKHYARWPREHQRADGRSSSGRSRLHHRG